ncbi:hypothetical protein WA026_013365 [Henosepilachna vigintioctopunctata]|uniref:Ribosomal protein S14 n=1 Tax=Henosepilachna vigintioctopunctata TaxID=420089 RepID=A0AAW1VFI9_9CUCU
MRKKIQKLLLCPKKTPKTNAQRQQEYRENRKKMQLSEDLDLIRKRMNADRSKRYRDKLKLKKRQTELDYPLSSKEDFLPT